MDENNLVALRNRLEGTPPNPTGEKVSWPAWFYGPDNQSAIFDSEDQVPQGWEDHWDKVKNSDAAKAIAKAKETDPYKDMTDGDIMKALDDAEIEYKSDWPRDKLVAVLKASKEAK